MWWFFYNLDVPNHILNEQIPIELALLNGESNDYMTGILYLMSFIIPKDELALFIENGYLYTFGYPTMYLSLGIPFLGLIFSFIFSFMVVKLYQLINSIKTFGDFLYVLSILLILSPLIIFVQIGSLSSFLTIALIFKIAIFLTFFLYRKLYLS